MPRKVTPTYVLLNQITLAATSPSVTFSSIAQSYSDLILVGIGSNSADTDLALRFNGDTGTNYSGVRMFGSGSGSGSSSADTGKTFAEIGGVNTSIGDFRVQIMDYSATDKHKTALTRGSKTGSYVVAWANRWASNTAIYSVTLYPVSGSFQIGATFSLYGVL
jgi:hypothetical protein